MHHSDIHRLACNSTLGILPQLLPDVRDFSRLSADLFPCLPVYVLPALLPALLPPQWPVQLSHLMSVLQSDLLSHLPLHRL